MAKFSFPFDDSATYEEQWARMAKVFAGTGVNTVRHSSLRDELKVSADGTGLYVDVSPGEAWIMGHYFISDATERLSIAPNDGTTARRDLVILRLDWTENNIDLAVLQGSDTDPALTQALGVRWEYPLARVLVQPSSVRTYIAASDVQEMRTVITSYGLAPACRAYSTANVSIPNATWTSIPFDVTSFDDNFFFNSSNNTRLTIRTKGVYSISGTVKWAGNSTGIRSIRVNRYSAASGTLSEVAWDTTSAADTTQKANQVNTHYWLNEGDYLTLDAYQNSGAALSVLSSLFYSPCLSIARVGD